MFFLVLMETEFGYALRGDFSAQWRALQGADLYNGAGSARAARGRVTRATTTYGRWCRAFIVELPPAATEVYFTGKAEAVR